MERLVIPAPLAARIAKLVEPVPRRIIFKVRSVDALHIRRIIANFKEAIRRIYGQQSYSILWFRCKDGSITIAIAGTRSVVAYVELFLTYGRSAGLFSSGEVLYEGMGAGSFEAHVTRQLRQYATTPVAHSFGGTNS